MENPFVYGEVVPAAAFVDRVDELDRLVRDLASGQKVFLISPRRYGKSSLIRQALRAVARGGALTTDITVSSYSSYLAFLEGYTRALIGMQSGWDKARGWLKDAIGATRPELRLEADSTGTMGMSVKFPSVRSERDISRLAADVFALPGRLSDERKTRIVIALDEFQAIGGFNGGSVEHAMRAAVQHQRSVGYVFAGSEPSLMERMLGAKRPFYKAGPVMRLEKIPPDIFSSFIESRFSKTGIKPEAGLGASIVDLAGNMPYNVQRLAHESWDDARAAGKRRIGVEELHETLHRLLAEQDTMFEAIWQRLTLAQRATLRAVVLAEGRELLSADLRNRYRLGGASTVQTALQALGREDLIAREADRYVVVDSLMREWIAPKNLLKRLGLERPEVRAWTMYDWANSAFSTTIITAVFPVYFTSVAGADLPTGEATRLLARTTTIALAVSAMFAPVLGALADYAPVKKRLLAICLAIGCIASGCLSLVYRGDWLLAAVLFGIGNIGFTASLTFYDSLLPHIARGNEIDRVSTAGYAIGYLGGGVLLALNVAWILSPGTFGIRDAAQASRLSFLSVAIWWLAFSIPLFKGVPEPRTGLNAGGRSAGQLIKASFSSLKQSIADLRRYRNALLLLIAFVSYNDGISTIIRLATSYGTEIGLNQGALITAILLVQFAGIPFSLLFGVMAGRIGAKTSIFIALGMYVLITVMGYHMKTERDFYVLALMVATVQGGSQALSRSLYASMIPKARSSEFFGFFSIFEKFGAILGPAAFEVASRSTGSSRSAILSVMVFFVAGAVILSFVNVPEGRKAVQIQ